MRMRSLVLAIAVATLSACATTGSTVNLPWPENLNITPPSPGLAPELAAFSGIWEGNWDGGLASRLAVEQIDTESARVVYAWDDSPPYFKGGWTRIRAKVSGGKIEWGTPPNPQFSFRMSGDRTTMHGERVRKDDVMHTVVMRKVTPPAK